MKAIIRNRSCAAILGVFLALGATSSAHPGPPGHTHFPDEVDEFDQVAVSAPEKTEINAYDVGGIAALLLVGACLTYAFSQRRSGVWKDATTEH